MANTAKLYVAAFRDGELASLQVSLRDDAKFKHGQVRGPFVYVRATSREEAGQSAKQFYSQGKST